jgi:hypothetical protein
MLTSVSREDGKVSAGAVRAAPDASARVTLRVRLVGTAERAFDERRATLDYTLLAEYACIDPAGLVTIVGGSFDRVQATSTSGAQQTYVAANIYQARIEGRMLKVMVARDRDTSQTKHAVTAAWEDDDGI